MGAAISGCTEINSDHSHISRIVRAGDSAGCGGQERDKIQPRMAERELSEQKELKGLAVARMVGHISYLSEEGMEKKFGRRLEDPAMAASMSDFEKQFDNNFAVEGYLAHQGKKFVERFDANSYIYVTKAMDYFDVDNKYGGGSLNKAMKKIKAEVLMVSFSSDWLFSPAQAKEIVQALTMNNKDVSYIEIESIHGHDAFLLDKKSIAENKIMGQAFKNFLIHIK